MTKKPAGEGFGVVSEQATMLGDVELLDGEAWQGVGVLVEEPLSGVG